MVEKRKGDDYLNCKDFERLGLPLNDHQISIAMGFKPIAMDSINSG